MKLLLIDNRVRSIDIITNSLEQDVEYIIFDYETETLESFKSKITKEYDSIGIVQEQDNIPTYTLSKLMGDYDLNDYGTWTTYIELVQWFTTLGMKYLDLIECNIDSTWQTVITSLQEQFNITIRSSSKQLGNTNLGDNWVFDDGSSLIGIYFTNTINEYPYTLGSGYSLGTNYLIDKNGVAWGSGFNTYGQLGTNIISNTWISKRRIYIPWPSSETQIRVVQASAGNWGVVFLLVDGTCYACGYNYSYCLGLENINTYYSTATKINISNVESIASGWSSTIFLLKDGTVTATGLNYTGATCYGETANVTYKLKPNLLKNVSLLSGMIDQTMFVYQNEPSRIYFCGFNTLNSTICLQPTLLLDSTVNVKQIESGGASLYYVDASNNLYGGGANNVGQLAQGTTTTATSWSKISGPSGVLNNNVLKVSSAGCSLLILTLNGTLYLAGLTPFVGLPTSSLPDVFGTIGPGNTAYYTTSAVAVPGGSAVFDINIQLYSAGNQPYTGAGAFTATEGYCVKIVDYIEKYYRIGGGQISNLSLTPESTPSTAITSTNQIDTFYRLVGLIDSSLNPWFLGNFITREGAFNSLSTFTVNTAFNGIREITFTNQGFLNMTDSAGLSTYLNVYGNNIWGELTDSRYSSNYSLWGLSVSYVTINSYTLPSQKYKIFSGLYHSLFMSGGVVYSFGLNNYGQLGQGNTTNLSNRDTSISALSSKVIVKCCCGLYSSYFLSSTGELYACGYNYNRELGTNFVSATVQSFYLTPVQLTGTFTDVACGYNHSLTLVGGIVYASGVNNYGQLGLGNINIYSGYQVVNISLSKLFAGENRSAGITSNNTLYAWGKDISIIPLVIDINITTVYQVSDIGIIYIKNSRYYVAYGSDILAPYASGPIANITPYYFSTTPPLTIYSNICFLEGTQVKCDQGLIEIEKINPDIHTILNKKIVAITETYSTEKELVVLEKDELRPNVPNKKTVTTMEHKIFFKGKMTEARKLTKNRQPYKNEKLYNVLMEEHNKMNVNNMVVETLDPSNTIGIIFKGLRDA